MRVITGILVWCMALLCIPEANTLETVRIGVSLSFSGIYTEPCYMTWKGYTLWQQQVNEKGGLLGRPVQLVILDDRSDEGLARQNYRQLLYEEKVDLVLSPYSTPLTLAASEITEEAGYVMVTSAAASNRIWERGYKYIFGGYATADRYFIGYLDLIARERIRKVSIFFENNSFNRDAAEGAVKWAANMGVEVVNYVAYEPEEESPAKVVQRTGIGSDEALIICGYTEEGYEFLTAVKQYPTQPAAIAMTIAPVHPLFAERVGEMAEGVFAPSQWEPMERIPYPGTREFIRDFRSFAKLEPAYHAGAAYATGQVLEEAVTRTGSLDNKVLRDYISTMKTVTVIGPFEVNQRGEQIGHEPLLIQWQNGEKEIVYPRDVRTKAPVFR